MKRGWAYLCIPLSLFFCPACRGRALPRDLCAEDPPPPAGGNKDVQAEACRRSTVSRTAQLALRKIEPSCSYLPSALHYRIRVVNSRPTMDYKTTAYGVEVASRLAYGPVARWLTITMLWIQVFHHEGLLEARAPGPSHFCVAPRSGQGTGRPKRGKAYVLQLVAGNSRCNSRERSARKQLDGEEETGRKEKETYNQKTKE